ncbi:MAG: hypothetical protein RQ735_10460 [Flavobacteriaceae bacterium]|nr:hypothetical protein [Flavobacteriaceae bacterium]
MRKYFYMMVLCFPMLMNGQDVPSLKKSKWLKINGKKELKIDSVSIQSKDFALYLNDSVRVDTLFYRVDFSKAMLIFENNFEKKTDSVRVSYQSFPNYLTRIYQVFDDSLIVENNQSLERVYSLENKRKKTSIPFDGLNTTGSITRGVTIGNNQNSVLKSELDLQISGDLGNGVTLRASIQDNNIPLQENGFSQRLDEFDEVFIELFTDNWNVRAGDINLVENESYFSRFQKRVQGILVGGKIQNKTSETKLFGSGAVVRGQFTRSTFQGREGNQGPYKLQGPNGELFVLVISGSETVYVNGLPLQRGEDRDYVIDYNAGELTFTSLFPITSDMRIVIEYQFTDRNFTRFITYDGASFKKGKLSLSGTIYSESDSKNQPLQQSLTESQKESLSLAGDDRSKMVAPSAVPSSFSENKALYRKIDINGVEVFEFSTDPNEELFEVRFTEVGANQGNYILTNANVIGRIFTFVLPENGVPQGNFEPVIQLIAPTRLQLATVKGKYELSEKTSVEFEGAFSNNDLNLFSDLDDENNTGFAGTIRAKHRIFDKLWNLDATFDFDHVNEDFRTIERLYNVEFNRDWSLINPVGNQNFLRTGWLLSHPEKGMLNYQFQQLSFEGDYSGSRHVLTANLHQNRWRFSANGSYLDATSDLADNSFLRWNSRLTYSLKKQWFGADVNLENNKQRDADTNILSPLSQRFEEYTVFTGVGDSTKIFAEVGYRFRTNDSIRNNLLEKVNTSQTYFLKSRILNSATSQLQLFVNYRRFDNQDSEVSDEQSLNSRLFYNRFLWDKKVQLNTVFETNSGTQPQQDFTFVEVEPGTGSFTWFDFNGNGLQELDEFEQAAFQDEANFVRVLLPNRVFIKTHQNKLSQILTLNPMSWSSEEGYKKRLSHFYNQTNFLIDRRVRREDDQLDLNPFDTGDKDLLGLNFNLRNTLFYNRGLQKFTTSYTFNRTQTQNFLSTGIQEGDITSHQLQFTHKFDKYWLFNYLTNTSKTQSTSENFPTRNFDIDAFVFNPKLSYLFTNSAQFDVFYEFQNKENQTGAKETLDRHKAGVSFFYANMQKLSVTGEFNFFSNQFDGDSFSPVGFQILEGLQPGTNFTWQLNLQKRLTQFLDFNVQYSGRKSENIRTIHTGTMQLRAFF